MFQDCLSTLPFTSKCEAAFGQAMTKVLSIIFCFFLAIYPSIIMASPKVPIEQQNPNLPWHLLVHLTKAWSVFTPNGEKLFIRGEVEQVYKSPKDSSSLPPIVELEVDCPIILPPFQHSEACDGFPQDAESHSFDIWAKSMNDKRLEGAIVTAIIVKD